jgi:hypothetical protein
MPFSRKQARGVTVPLCLALACTPVLAQVPAAPKPFPTPDAMTYSIEWRLINAGTARITLERSGAGWQTHLVLQSAGLVSKLYKVDDKLTAHYEKAFCIQNSTMNTVEGKRRRDTHVNYDYERGKASYLERDLVKNSIVKQSEIDIPACVHDVIGGLLYLRGQAVEPGRSISVPMSDGKKFVSARIEAQEREDIKIAGKVYKTIRYEAFVLNKVLYQRSGRLLVWMTEDPARLPVRIQIRTGFPIGTVTLELDKIEQS